MKHQQHHGSDPFPCFPPDSSLFAPDRLFKSEEICKEFVYVCWKDSRVILVMSTAHPGHASEKKAARTVINRSTGIV